MTFEFTREQREAWRVLKPCYDKAAGHDTINGNNWSGVVTSQEFDAAAARFDAREATCGIEPLSKWHHFLGTLELLPECVASVDPESGWGMLNDKGLTDMLRGYWEITDRGREVLANLNAMCRVEK